MKLLSDITSSKSSTKRIIGTALAVLALGATTGFSAAASSADTLHEQAQSALKKAATFYRTKVALHGGYTYYYSEDLKNYWGEGVGNADQIWVEPPGTPSVGLAYLKAYSATGDSYYLDAARETGLALVHGQLESGGWSQRIDFDPKGKFAGRYRNGKGDKKGPNNSSLDDDQTQSSIIFLCQLDRALEFKDAAIHDASLYALDSLLKAQFPIGAFPQGWSEPVSDYPILKASFPKDWPRLWPHEPYYRYYTLNDGLVGTVSEALLVAIECYKDERYKKALSKLGDFLILAQMPDPQPAWAQQYNFEMQPTWARKFEPPAIAGLESEDAIRTLMKIYRVTGDEKYLEPIPRALTYLKTGVLPDGRMPRYRELETNRALYMTRKPGVSGNSNAPGYYDFSYSDANLPAHYGWKQETSIKELAAEYEVLKKDGAKPASRKVAQSFTETGKLVSAQPNDSGDSAQSRAALEKQVREIVTAQDSEGRWVNVYDGERLVGQPKFAKGFRFIGSHTFNHHMEVLAAYLSATEKK
ncbi:pectic acid lyase [Nibricoccus aquaticus]|uniref:Pectic acid lyase n=1 Tax=Nibricoccus aquaticus TaxID=2576891 RepID=A0A290QBI8_9BACT|nr:pectate lyase [Nibricoccus aquaticus]ATC65813.1 pectic acid lyase [Nibricoccus aquaticus]